MKKLVLFLIVIVSLIVIISSCQNIPTISGKVLNDPTNVSEPSEGSWGDDIRMNLAIDKSISSITPIGISDTMKVKVTFLDYDASKVVEDNFKVFEDERAQGFSMLKMSNTVRNVDIVIVMDVTGSMGNEIDGLKNSLVNFIDYLKKGGFDVQVGIVPYDDYAPAGGNDYPTYDPAWQDLTDPDTAATYVSNLYASGGDDGPENAYGAIMYAWNNASWRAGAQRIFVLLTDAISHCEDQPNSSEFYSEYSPKYTRDEVLKALEGYATLYMVASTGYYYNEGDTDFSDSTDPREIAVKTGGFVIYQSGGEEVDLTKIGIAESIKSTFIIEFQSDSPEKEHEISVYYEGPDGEQGHAEITAEY